MSPAAASRVAPPERYPRGIYHRCLPGNRSVYRYLDRFCRGERDRHINRALSCLQPEEEACCHFIELSFLLTHFLRVHSLYVPVSPASCLVAIFHLDNIKAVLLDLVHLVRVNRLDMAKPALFGSERLPFLSFRFQVLPAILVDLVFIPDVLRGNDVEVHHRAVFFCYIGVPNSYLHTV